MSRSKLLSAAIVALPALALLASCQLLIGLDGGKPLGTGGTGGSTTASPSSNASSASASSSGASSSNASSGTGGASSSSMASSSMASSSMASSSTASSSSMASSSTASSSSMASSSSTASSSAASSSSTGAGGADGGPCAPCPTVVLLAGGAAEPKVLAGVFGGTTWSPATLAGTTSDGMSIAVLPATGEAVGLMRAAAPANQLQYTLWNGASWSPFASLHGDATQGEPAIVATGAVAHAVYWENATFLYKHETFANGAWGIMAQPISPAGATQAPCGPNPPALAPLGAAAALVFVNGSCGGATNHLFNTDLSGAAWLASKDLAANPSFSSALRPAVAAPASGPELLVAYVDQGGTQVWFAARTSGVWSPPQPITNALTADPLALAPLPGSGAVLAYRGTDGKLYTSVYAGAWSPPAGIASVTVNAAPALARGIGAAKAELAYTDGSGVFHTRLVGTVWTAPVQVAPGTGFSRVALGSGP